MTNAIVFEKAIKPLLAQIKLGYNATCFAYGMTGAGKTHTMFGSGHGNLSNGTAQQRKAAHSAREVGIASLAVKELFAAGDAG